MDKLDVTKLSNILRNVTDPETLTDYFRLAVTKITNTNAAPEEEGNEDIAEFK